jgi:peroxiredoxin
VVDDLRDLGAELVALTPELPEHSAEVTRKHNLRFDVLSDRGNGVTGAFGLVHTLPEDLRRVYREHFKIDLPHYNGDDSWTLPLPARYVIAPGGVIASAEVNPDYTRRPEPAVTVDEVRRLAG